MFRFTELAFVVATWSLAAAHTVIVYPGWRGDNIHTNGTVSDTDHSIKPGSLGINYEGNGTYGFPYGMQWMYPCMLLLFFAIGERNELDHKGTAESLNFELRRNHR